MASSMSSIERMVEQDRRQLHGLHHPNRHRDPLIVERAEGVWLHGVDGRKVLDAMAGLWNVNIGYGNQELPDVARDQMQKLAYTSGFVGMTNSPSIELAERLAGMVHPTLNSVYFVSGGSEANETAFKTARYYWRRRGRPEKVKFVSRRDAYHGITMAAASATGVEKYWKMFGLPIEGFLHAASPNEYRYEGTRSAGEDVAEAAARDLEETILNAGPESVAGVILEPIQGAGGLIVPPDGYLERVRRICDRHEVLLIADEVITGFGRTGRWFGIEHWGLRPDIVTFAKGVTSGYLPLGGMLISDEIRDAVENAPEDESWMHGFTYSGHAAACAVGIANIEIMRRENLVEKAAAAGRYFGEELARLRDDFETVDNVRGRGLLWGIEIVTDRESRRGDPETAAAVAGRAMDLGLRVRPVGQGTIAFSPALSITKDEIDQIIERLGSALDGIAG